MLRTAFLWMLFGVSLLAAIPATTGEEDAAPKMVVQEWRLLGPLLAPLPVFGDESADDAVLKSLLGVRPLPPDRGIEWFGQEVLWGEAEVTADGAAVLSAPAEVAAQRAAVAWLSAQLDMDRFVSVVLAVESEHPVEVIIDGEAVGERGT